jgi:hypothetical protein
MRAQYEQGGGGMSQDLPIPSERIERGIFVLRGQRVMLDADLAELYGVPTKALNQAVKRNADRFPPDFMFQLTDEEKLKVVTTCDHLRKLKFSPTLPYAFTEHGAVMLASVLNSPTAVQASLHVVRAFVRLRQLLASHEELAKRVEALEKKYDRRFRVVFEAVKQLMAPERKQPGRKIGFE